MSSSRGLLVSLCGVLVLAGIAAAGTGEQREWKQPLLVERQGSLPYLGLAMTRSGRTLMAWAGAQEKAIHYRTRGGPGRPFRRTRTVLFDTPEEEVHRFDFVGLDARGDGVVGYRWFDDTDQECCSRLAVRVRRRDEADLGARQTLSLPGDHALNPSFASASDGRSAIVWFDRDEVWLSERRPGRRFGRPVRVAAWQSAYNREVLAAYDGEGTLVVVWAEEGRLRARVRGRRGRFGRVMTVQTPGERFEPDFELAVAMNARGRAIVAAVERIRDFGHRWRIVTAEREPGARRFEMGRVVPFGPVTPDTGRGGSGWSSGGGLQVTLDRSDRGLVAWHGCGDEPPVCGVEVARRKRDGSYERSRTVNQGGDPQLVMSPRGHGVLVWAGRGGTRLAKVVRPGGSLGRTRDLGGNRGLHHQAAIDARGNALLGWVTTEGIYAQAYEP